MDTGHLALGRMVAAGAALLGVFCIANGVAMLAVPVPWFWAVPGVPATGGYNAHFIRDIGIVYLMTGLGLLLAARKPQHRPLMFGAAAAWLTSHAVFHLIEVAAGICGPEAIPRDFIGVTLPALAAAALLAAATRMRAAVEPPALHHLHQHHLASEGE